MTRKTLKTLAATVGGGALIAMGGLGAATSWAAPDPEPPGPIIQETEISTGETTVESVATTTLETPSAEPSITGPAPLPSEEEGLPG